MAIPRPRSDGVTSPAQLQPKSGLDAFFEHVRGWQIVIPSLLLILGGSAFLALGLSSKVFERVAKPAILQQYGLQQRLPGAHRSSLDGHVRSARRALIFLAIAFISLGAVGIGVW